jgi:peptidoglycan/LPS O-acetylase OafA/YrhL
VTTRYTRDRVVPTTRKPGIAQVHDGRRSDIQGLRAVAVVLVVAFHAGLPVPGGFIGVDMFFVISGFVIAGMLLRQLQQTSTLDFASFYTRRMRRILPALALLIVFAAVGSTLLLSPLGPQQATAKTGIAASLFSANLELSRAGGGAYFGLAAESNALLHTWSLSVEEQFYFVFPAFLVVVWRLGERFAPLRSPRRVAAACILVATATSFGLSCYGSLRGVNHGENAFYSPATRAWEFGAGVLLALAAPAIARLSRRFAGSLGIGGVMLIGVGALTITGRTPFPGVAALLPVVGTVLILLAGMNAERGVTALLGTRPAIWLGDVSYGWYLWHWPLIVFAAALWPRTGWVLVAAAIASLGPTWLSYHFIENPIRFNDRLTGRRVVPLIAVCITVPIAACLSLLLTNRLESRIEAVKELAAVGQNPGGGRRGCTSLTPIGERADSDCTWPVEQPLGTIVLVGDSNAEQFIGPASLTANQLGYSFTAATPEGCPFVDLIRVPGGFENGTTGDACHRFVTESLDALTRQLPTLVIIASSSSQWVNNDGGFRDPASGQTARSSATRAEMWEQGLGSVVRQLSDRGIPTLIIHPVPHLGDVSAAWQPVTCPAIRIFSHSCGDTTVERAVVERQQQLARDAENRAVAGQDGATTIDFTEDLCSAESCASKRDGVALYRDGTHLSVDGALTLTDRFRQLIRDETVHP